MDSLIELIRLLNSKDKRQFKVFLKEKNTRSDVKNLQLLDIIVTDDIKELNELYPTKKNKDAYHALRKRLQDNLLLFLSQKTFESNHSETHEALRLVIIGRFLLENEMAKIAFKCLNKAEHLAKRLEQFNLLNEILLLKIQYAHLSGAEELESITTKFSNNQSAMQSEAKLNMAYAYLRQELQEIHLKGKIVDLTAVMLETIKKYKISEQDLLTYKSIYQILFIANEYAAIQQNYSLIERYIEQTDRFLNLKEKQKHPYLFQHISILYFLANFHLRRKNFLKSASYLRDMADLMAIDNSFNNIFQIRHQLLLVLNLFFTGHAADAIVIAKESISKSNSHSKQEDVEDLKTSLTMFLAMQNNRESLKQLSLLTRTDAWYEKKLGMLWTIRKNLMEILVQTQFDNLELALSRINSFRRRYKTYLLKISEQRVLTYLKLVEKHLLKPEIIFDKQFKKEIFDLLKQKENQDIFTLSFLAWLVARWEKKSAYEVVLEFLGSYHTKEKLAVSPPLTF